MAFNLYDSKGCALEQQRFIWRELVQSPISKLDDDAFTRVRLILMNGIENESIRFQHMAARMNVGPQFSDPVARQLYAEIASIEEQHITQYSSILDPSETWLEQWLLHEANEVYNYYGCLQQESNVHVKAIWERFLDYELGHFHAVSDLFKQYEKRDPTEILPLALPEPIDFKSHREFVRQVLSQEVDLRANGTQFVDKPQEGAQSRAYRDFINRDGSPSESVAAGYAWVPGTELNRTSIAVD